MYVYCVLCTDVQHYTLKFHSLLYPEPEALFTMYMYTSMLHRTCYNYIHMYVPTRCYRESNVVKRELTTVSNCNLPCTCTCNLLCTLYDAPFFNYSTSEFSENCSPTFYITCMYMYIMSCIHVHTYMYMYVCMYDLAWISTKHIRSLFLVCAILFKT